MLQETAYTCSQIREQAWGLQVTREHNRFIEIAPDQGNPNSWHDFYVKRGEARRRSEDTHSAEH